MPEPLPREVPLPADLTPEQIQEIEDTVFRHCDPQKSDLLFCFGYSEPNAEWLLNIARQEWAPWILVTGKHPATEPQANPGESHLFRQILVEGGIDRRIILVEDRSTNTLENVLFGKEILAERGIEPKSILAACKSHHAGRAVRTLKKQFPDAAISCIVWDPSYDGVRVGRDNWRETEVGRGRVYGEFLRIQAYAKKGDIG